MKTVKSIKDLIMHRDYDYVDYRILLPDGSDVFAGCFRTAGGKIFPLDGESYDENETVVKYETWENKEEDIRNGLTVIVAAK